jgi:CRP/FNR family cyclic AMP-dependent transcriptional regulator
MDAHQIQLLAGCALPTSFKAGEIIFRAGETANHFYLIENGTVVIEGTILDAAPVIIDTISAGDSLGWSWLFPPYVWHFDARATEPTIAFSFDTRILRQHYDEDLTLGNELFKRSSEVMVRRLQATRRKLIQAMQESPG